MNKKEKTKLSVEETIEITNNIIKAQAKTWGKLHPAYALAENMGLLDDEDILEDMYEKHRTDTFRVVCEVFCCDPKEVLRKMIEHRNEVMPKIIEAEKKSIVEDVKSDSNHSFINNVRHISDEDLVVEYALDAIYDKLNTYNNAFSNGLNREEVINKIKERLK